MVDKAFQLLLLLSPIVYGVNISFHKFDLRFFEIGAITLFVASLFDTPKRDIQFKFAIFLLFALVVLNALIHKFQPLDIYAIQLLFFGILGFYIIVRYLNDVQSCYKYIFWALAINIVVLLFQKIGYSPIVSFPHQGSFIGCEGGMLGNNAKFGIYLALVLPYLPFFIAVVLAFTFGVFMPYAQLSILIPLILITFCKAKNKVIKGVVVACAISSIILHQDKILESISLRWTVWKPIIEMIFERPLIGWGLGTYQLWTATESFNSYLPFVYGLGLLGAVWLGWVIKGFFKKFNPDRESLAVLSLMLVSFIEYPFEIPRLWFTIIAVLGFYAIKKEVCDVGDV